MSSRSIAFRLGATFAASAMVFSSTAMAAPTGLNTSDPLVSLSLFGTSSSRAAVCAAGAASAAAASVAATAGQPAPNCVLPVVGQPVAAVPPPAGVAPVATGLGGISSLLPLAAIAALGLAAIFRLEKQDDSISPN